MGHYSPFSSSGEITYEQQSSREGARHPSSGEVFSSTAALEGALLLSPVVLHL